MKKLTCIILTVLLVFSSVWISPVYAVEQSNAVTKSESGFSHPISVNIETNKTNYGTTETANFTVVIKNESAKKVENISSECTFNDLQPINSLSKVCIDGVSLNPNEKAEYSFNAILKPSRVGFFARIILLFKTIFSGSKAIPSNKFDNGRNIIETDMDVKFGSLSINDKVKTYYENNVEVITTEDETDFINEISKLTNATLNSASFNETAAQQDDYYAGRIVVKADKIKDLNLKQYNADTIIYNDDCAVMQFSSSISASQCAEVLSKNKNVEYVEPDVLMTTQEVGTSSVVSVTSDNNYTWGEKYIFADSYSKYLEANQFFNLMTVAVVDTGADLDHPFLKNKILSSGYNFIGFNSKPEDDNGHGTHVSGIIADCTNNLNVKIMPVKTMNKDGQGYSEMVAQGIYYAANNGADVINLSISGGKSVLIDEAIDYVTEKGVVVCAAAGNGDENNNPIDTKNLSPSGNKNAIVVSAIDQSGKTASFSNYGESVDVAAPGVKVSSAYSNGSFAEMSGTSMATPHISAVAAMFKLANPGYSPSKIESLIADYCEDLGESGKDSHYGNGKVNMYNAIPDCTIRFDSNGGTSVNDEKLKSSFEFILPTPTKAFTVTLNANGGNITTTKYNKSCTMDGWYKNSSFSGVRYAPGNEYMAKTDETLYAKWTNPTLGSVNEPTRSSYSFAGWYTSADGGTKYTSTSQINSNITLYAHWTLITRTVPNVVGQQYSNAKNTLEDMGFKVNLATGYNENYAPNVVYAQSLAANSVVPIGSTITLTYCTGTTHYKYYHMWNGRSVNNGGKWGSDSSMPNGARHEIDLTYPLSPSYSATYQWYGDYTCPQCGAVHMWLPAGTYIG